MTRSCLNITRAAFVAGLVIAAGPSRAASASLVPFDQFIKQVSSAPAGDSAGKPASPSADAASFQESRQHILGLYAGVTVRHSYLVDSHPYDCVPIEQQPSVRMQKLPSIASPPPGPSAPEPVTKGMSPTIEQLDPAQKTDQLGNAMSCDAGSIPMRRVTLEDIGRFKTLKKFLQKSPSGEGRRLPRSGAVPPETLTHKYAHSYQFVSNVGGTSDLSLWNPQVNLDNGEVFSLTQFWYSNSSGPVQTVEMGLQNFPDLYNTNNTVLFVYWTSDGYVNTGCYNLDCSGFVQTNGKIHLGAGFGHYSTNDGPQYYVTLKAILYNGNWWVYLGGGAPSNAIGYYPAALFGGQGMSYGADEIDYGGEVVGSTSWPAMGSGRFAAAGFGRAAFHRNVNYYPDTTHSTAANLSVDQRSLSCFTDVTHDNSGVDRWNTFFYFGGPGGTGC